MFSLLFSAIVFKLISYDESESIVLILLASISLLFSALIYLFNQIAGRLSTNFLGVFSVSTNFWCIFSLVLSIDMGTGTEWSFSRIINHPYTPVGSIATFSDYALALSYNSLFLLIIYFLSLFPSVKKTNLKLNILLFESINGFNANKRLKIFIYIFNSSVLLGSISFGVIKGLGGGGYEETLLGMIVQWIWLVSLPITAFGLNSVITSLSKGLIHAKTFPALLSLISVMTFTLILGRRSVFFVVITILFFWCKSLLALQQISSISALRALALVLNKLKRPKTYSYLLVSLVAYILITTLINTYQILRISPGGMSFENIYNSFIIALFNSDSISSLTRNESQAGRLMLMSTLAQLISRYRYDPTSFQANSFSELVDPLLNAIPAVVLKALTGISKTDLIFGEKSLSNILGYKIDFIDILSASSFTAFAYFGLVITPIILIVFLYNYFNLSLRILKVNKIKISNSFLESYKYLSWLSLVVFVALGGYTDAMLSTYFRSFLLTVFIAFIFTIAIRLIGARIPSPSN